MNSKAVTQRLSVPQGLPGGLHPLHASLGARLPRLLPRGAALDATGSEVGHGGGADGCGGHGAVLSAPSYTMGAVLRALY